MRPTDRKPRLVVTGAILGPCLVLCFVSAGDGQVAHPHAAADWREYQRAVQPFFAKHCFACHAEKESGDVRLDRFTDEAALAKGLATVEKALDMLKKRSMPPKKRPPPGDDETKPVRAWMENFLARMDLSSAANRVVIRRLNRAEYNNTVRDLMGV